MSTTDLVFNIIGNPKSAVAALKRVGKEGEAQRSKLKVAFAGIGLAVGGGLAAVFKTGFDEAKDAAAGTAQLAAGIKSTGNAAHVTVGGLNDLASQIQNYSGQTDDSIVKSEQLLLTFTNIHNATGKNNDIFNQATKITADMAAKMGTDASSSAVLLGKALNDPAKGLTALTRVGVSFTAGQIKQIKSLSASGKTMQAQKVILGELSKEFGGAAKAAGDSLPGKIDRAKRAFEDVSQAVVEDLMPIIQFLANFLLNKVLPAFKAVTEFIMRNKTVFSIIAATIGTIVVAVKAWAIGQAILNAVMEANPIMLVVTALAAIAAGLYVAYQKSETFRDIVKAAFDAVKLAGQALWTGLKAAFDSIKTALKAIGDAASWMWNNVLHPVFNFISAGVRGLWNGIVKPYVDLISAEFRILGDGLQWAWKNVVKPVIGFVKGAIRDFKGWLSPVISGISNMFIKIGNGLKWAWDNTIGPIFKYIKDGLGIIQSAWNFLTGSGGSGSDWLRNIQRISDTKNSAPAPSGPNQGNNHGRNAQGTGFWRGGWTSMNELGKQELAYLPSGTAIMPGAQVQSMLGGSSGGTNIFVTVQGSLISAQRELVEVLEKYAGTGGRIRIAKAVH